MQRIHATLLAADVASSLPYEPPHQLPSDIDRFTGRTEALELLDRSAAVTVVHGTAGVGKTALAIHWAHLARDFFPDGELFLNLRGYGPGPPVEPATAVDGLLRGLGVPGQQIPEGLAARSALLRSRLAGRRVLILLDHARDAAQVEPLLSGQPVRVVVTSRSRLDDLTSQQEINLEQLTPAESVVLLRATLGDDPMLAELAELCGHLPLALVIAAEHVGREPQPGLAALVSELRDRSSRLDTLDIDDPAINPRAVFSWSYQALDSDTAACFRLLAVHPGADFSVRSAAALTGTPVRRATELLYRLENAHLVRRTVPDRYEMHDLLRAYATELCSDDERDSALHRVHSWYLHSAANARTAIGSASLPVDLEEPERDVVSFDDSAQALDWLDRERQNLVLAVHEAAVRGAHSTAYRTTHVLHSYLTLRYMLDDVFALQRRAIDAARSAGDVAAEATSTIQLAMTINRLGRHEEAIAQVERALRLFEAADSDLGRAAAFTNLGFVLSDLGHTEEAIVRYEQAIEVAGRLREFEGLALALNNLGLAYVDLGRYEEAEHSCRRAVDIHIAHGDRIGEAATRDSLGQALAGQRRYREAIHEYTAALAVHMESGDLWEKSATLTHLGAAQRAAGHPDEARASWRQALDLYDEIGANDTPELRRADLIRLLSTVS